MEFSATQEIISKLKAVKDQRQLSVPQIKKMIDGTGTYISLTTLRRVFADGSETEDSFSYENTLRPIARALLMTDSAEVEDAGVRAKLEGLEAVFRLKNEIIDSLHKQIEDLKQAHERRCREYEGRMDFLRNQIELKDQRMDRKDEMISRLMDQLLRQA